jgi:hypothetical protein
MTETGGDRPLKEGMTPMMRRVTKSPGRLAAAQERVHGD